MTTTELTSGVSKILVEEETLRAKEIVEGLLDLSRPVQVAPEPVDLRAATEEVVSRLREAAVLDGVEVSITGQATVAGHASKLRQVLSNLLRNAAEAAGPGDAVAVSLTERDGEADVAVRDTGPVSYTHLTLPTKA